MFSLRSQHIGSASSIQQNELVYKKKRDGFDPVILSYGEAPFRVDKILFNDNDWDRGCHYSEGLGVPEFRAEIANYTNKHFNTAISAKDNIMVSAGSKIISYYIAQAILNPGDSIVLHEPAWVSYQEHARLSGASTLYLGHKMRINEIDKIISKESSVKLVYLNNPNNPRGTVYTKDELIWLAEYCKNSGTYLAVDESYSDFVVDNTFFSCASLINNHDNVIVFNSLSKNFGLSGWRLGYCIANENTIKILNKFNQHLITCAPTCLQLALVGCLDLLRQSIQPQIRELNQKRKLVLELLDKHGFEYLSGTSTFYIFIDVSNYVSDTKQFVVDFLEEDNISLIPGGAYGENTSGFLRLSFAIEPLDRIDYALSQLSKRLRK